MKAKRNLGARGWLSALMTGALLSACQAHAPITSPQANSAQFTIDFAGVVKTLATKPNINWEDSALDFPAVRQQRMAHAAAYHTQALTGTLDAKLALPGSAISSSAPCYTFKDLTGNYSGPTPNTGDKVWVVTDSGTLYELDAATLAVLNSRSGLGSFSKSAVVVSADNNRIYLLTTSGNLLLLSANTLATIATIPLAGTGFSGTSPFVDYATNTNPEWNEDVYVVAGNGTINKVHTTRQSANTATTTLTSWTAGTALNYGGAISVSSPPLVWNGNAYFGTTTGTFFAVNTSSATVNAYNLAAYTSAQGNAHAITAPAAFDVNPSTGAVRALFVACGDRLDWIDPATGTIAASPSLVLDKIPPAPYAGTLASFGATTSNKTYTAADWISIAAKNPSPSRWGGASSNPVYNTGVTGYTIKFDPYAPGPTTPEIWSGNSNNNTVFPLDLSGTQQGSYSTGGNGYPNELCVDSSGDPWVSMQSGRVVKYAPSGAILATSANIGALWPQTDTLGNCWVTNGGTRVYKLNANATTNFSVAGFTQSFSVMTDSANNAWVTDYSNNNVTKLSPTGAKLGTYAVGTSPAYIAIDPTTGNLWTADNGSNTVTELSGTTGAKLAQWSVASSPWCVAFDPSGHLWVSDVSPGNGVEEIDKATGNVIQTFNMGAFGNAYEMTFDSNGFGWVATDSGILKISPLGNLEDIFASTSYGTTGDGNDSYGYMLFKIAKNAFSNFPVLSCQLLLTANSTPVSPENIDFFSASAYQGGGSTTLWAGYAGTPNVDYNNRPSVVGPVALSSSLPVLAGTQYSFSVPAVADQLNTSDTTNARWAFALQSQGDVLQSAAHWYSKLSATKAAQDPTLQVTLDSGASFPTTSGIQSQPYVDQNSKRVWIDSCNALFQLDYSSVANFESATSTLYNMTQGGRTPGTGPITSGKNYIFPAGNVLWTGSRAVCLDTNATGNTIDLNDFATPLTGATDKLGYYLNTAPGNVGISEQMLWDYVGGDVYLTTGNGYVIRASVLQ